MGSYVAYKLRDLFKDFDKKIAINGTPFPVDNDYGIPEKPFLLTLRHAKTGLEGKFYQNIFDKEEEYERYLKNPVERSIENRVEELQNLYENIKNTPKTYEPFFDKAFVSLNDKIIPSKNQMKFWQDFGVPVEKLESGHFPYYNFNSWKEFL
jgi:biotin synthesis protein BioG